MAEDRERDVVLSPNEYCYVLDKTKGLVSVLVGPTKMSLSTSDSLVIFSETDKKFVEAYAAGAIKTFVSAPENWYTILKNPTKNNDHPRVGTANSLPELNIGRKINIPGPTSFALYPGQMAKVVQGHRLNTNQYLLVKVYDTTNVDNDDYEVGQQIVIKGEDVSFYIPPTGFEVIPNADGSYVRDAVTLERLQYCIKKNEAGEKKYVNGPAVVFPEADETFINNPETNSPIFRAIELSDISGIYVKVIADYKDGDVEHKTGEELFITGKNQLIYYPRPEHAIIDYDGKVLHHAIAIPAGEGRYVLNRLTGDIKMVRGPKMYLPDPRFEVIVKRKLTEKECKLWYPGNKDVLAYNVPNLVSYASLDSFSNSRSIATTSLSDTCTFAINTSSLANGFTGQDNVTTDEGFKRGNTYSKPRTITIDNKFDGVVSIDVWTGYAINVVSKDGKRKTIVGPQTYLLEYNETLETVIVEKDGVPQETVFLQYNNQRIDNAISAQTKDFVDIVVDVSYYVGFMSGKEDDWFCIKDYVRDLSDYEGTRIKNVIKKCSLEEFYSNPSEIIENATVMTGPVATTSGKSSEKKNTFIGFANGMCVDSVEVTNVKILNNAIDDMLHRHQAEIVAKSLELSAANKEIAVVKELEKIENQKIDLEYQRSMHKIDVTNKTEVEKLEKQEKIRTMKSTFDQNVLEAEKALQPIKDAIKKAKLDRDKMESDQTLAWQKEHEKLESDRLKGYTDAVKRVVDSISPDLIAAMTTSSNADMLKEVATAISPYALANGNESVSDVVNRLLRGTPLEGIISQALAKKSEE